VLERWEFIHFPCEKDANRYKLKVQAGEDDLRKIIRMLSANSGRPFASLSHDYNWGIYFYGVDDFEKKRIVDTLKKICSDGRVGQSDISVQQELPPAFEDFLEATARELSREEASMPAPPPVALPAERPDPVMPDLNDRGTGPGVRPLTPPAPAVPASGPDPVEERCAPAAQQPAAELEALGDLLEEGAADGPGEMSEGAAPPPVTEAVPAPPSDEPLPESSPRIVPAGEQMIDEQPVRESPRPASPPPARASVEGGAHLNERYMFSEFVVGPNNRFTHAAAKAVADNPGKIYNPLFIYGGVGLGKTHLMHAVGHQVRASLPEAQILYVTTERFMSDVIESIGRGGQQEFRERYRMVDMLLIDDIQFLSESESTQEEFFHTFNALHENGKQIIITSDRPPKQLTTLEDRLRSRFEWGLIADIKSPNLETRVAILKKKNESGKINLADNMLLYIGSKLKSNIRELEGFLKRINAYAALTGQEVTLDLVKSIMRELLPEDELDEGDAASGEQAPAQAPQSAVMAAPAEACPAEQPAPPAPPAMPAPPAKSAPPPMPGKPAMPAKPAPPSMPSAKPGLPATPPPGKPSSPAAPAGAVGSGAEEVDPTATPIEVAFFHPLGKDEEFALMKEKFNTVIKKHKLKFRFDSVFERGYDCTVKINYAFFTELCKTNAVRIAVVLGPPEESGISTEDFANLLGAMMDDEKISAQLVPWSELQKDYRYLNLALDITLLKSKKQ